MNADGSCVKFVDYKVLNESMPTEEDFEGENDAEFVPSSDESDWDNQFSSYSSADPRNKLFRNNNCNTI
jgi:hypothetical protein